MVSTIPELGPRFHSNSLSTYEHNFDKRQAKPNHEHNYRVMAVAKKGKKIRPHIATEIPVELNSFNNKPVFENDVLFSE